MTGLQKGLIRLARARNKVCITATQMLESMIHSPSPTRAEVSDVANAVMDGTDAVMLSAETAVGKYPVRAVRTMAELCVGAEKHETFRRAANYRLEDVFTHVDEAIAMAVMYVANHLDVTAIIALTESGSTPLWMSRVRSDIPVFAFTRHEATLRRVSLYRGVYAVAFDEGRHGSTRPSRRRACSTGCCKWRRATGDLVVLTMGQKGVAGARTRCRSSPCRAPRRRRVPERIRKGLGPAGRWRPRRVSDRVLEGGRADCCPSASRIPSASSAAPRPARSTPPFSRPRRRTSSAPSPTWSTSGRTSRRARSTAPTTGRC
jgi:hypothetical protein